MSANTPKTDRKRSAPKSAFRPGVSGNPRGRPKKSPEEFELEAACRAKSPDALAVMNDLMTTSKQDSVRLQAAMAIIERAHGKPLQRSEVRTGPLDGITAEEAHALLETINAIRRARAPRGVES